MNEHRLGATLSCVELFAGAGGLSLGIHKAGFDHLALIEWDKVSTKTLRRNGKRHLLVDESAVIECDVNHVDLAVYEGKTDLLAGGPPCKPFSMAGKRLGQNDPRDMFPAFIKGVADVMPRAFLIENVRGLLRPAFQDYFDYTIKRLTFPLFAKREAETWQEHLLRLRKLERAEFDASETYVVSSQLVDAADYGLPQRRYRVFISGFRSDLGLSPDHLLPTHSKEALFREQWITGEYWDRYQISADQYLGPAPSNGYRTRDGEDSLRAWRTVRDATSDLPTPVQRGVMEQFPNHVQVPGARIYPPCHTGSYYDSPAKALKAGTHGTPGGENMVRESNQGDVRYFTTREAARLQAFHDDWYFEGQWGHCIRQLGDAVPVELGKAFAMMIHSKLTDNNLQTVDQPIR
tara:strand:+ start:40 stop:1254 length:1215 start_codon:yes stop_codon:yes gene_type:complete